MRDSESGRKRPDASLRSTKSVNLPEGAKTVSMSQMVQTDDNCEPEKLWNKNFILILLLSACNNSASMMVTPLVLKYALSLSIPLTVATTITSMLSIVALVLRPVSGFCSDRFNRKSIILCTSLGTSLCLLGYTLAGNSSALAAVRLFHGVVFSFSSVALIAFNTSFIPKENMGEGMGWMALAHIISYSLGPNLGLLLVERYSYRICFMTAAGICLMSLVIALCIPYRHIARRPAERGRFDINNMISLHVLPYAVLTGLWSCGNGLENNFLALVGEDRGISGVGMFFTAYSIALVMVRPWSGRLLDRRGIKAVMYPALLISCAGNLLLGYANALLFVILAGVLKAVGQGAGAPAIQANCIRRLGKEKSGVVSSTCYIGQDIGNAVAPIIGGYVASSYGYTAVFTSYAVILLILGSVIFFIKSSYDEKKYGSA